ncbi:hypothetical protein JCM11491_003349 [Sporobolomyces phaffii]
MSTSKSVKHRIIRTGQSSAINSSFALDPKGKVPGAISYDSAKYRFYYEWDLVESPTLVVSGSIRLSYQGYPGPQSVSIHFERGRFPPVPSGRQYFPATESFTISTEVEVTHAFDYGADEQPLSAIAQTASLRNQTPNDVCLYFPHTNLKLWANEAALSASTDYFRHLFSSGFSEAVSDTTVTSGGFSSKTKEEEASSLSDLPYEFDDSDDESDRLFANPVRADENATETSLRYKTITINDHTYTTYLSVLLWVGSGFIRFAPIQSACTFSGPPAQDRRAHLEHSLSGSNSMLPCPASPKSVYRLAHYLGLTDLAKLALLNLAEQLKAANVTHELFGDVSTQYPEVRQLCIQTTVKNWVAVSSSAAFKKAEERAEAGELDVGLILAIELMRQHGPK